MRAVVLLLVLAGIAAAQGLPPEVAKRQVEPGTRSPPALDDAVTAALDAARKAALPLIDVDFHGGRRLRVPGEFPTIQAAIDAAKSGDVVTVEPGTWFEQLVMKDGVKLVSVGSDEPVAVPGARLRLPRRALETILDGSKAQPSHRGMIDFEPGTGAHTIVDGFTIRNLPAQDHHVPGHAHAINVRGASPVLLNCYLLDNGSTGIGNHVVYADQAAPIGERDFRGANVVHEAEAILYHNIVRGSLGLGVGCNHLSAPRILGNEIFANDDSRLGEEGPSPGIGAKHGARPLIVGNLVHHNPGGGILAKPGAPQGAHPVDRPTQPTVLHNVVFRNGQDRPAISCSGGGSEERPVRFVGNFVYEAGRAGLGLSDGSFGVIDDNVVAGSAGAGIAVYGATAKLSRNLVGGTTGPAIVLVRGAHILEMEANEAPGYVVRGARFGR